MFLHIEGSKIDGMYGALVVRTTASRIPDTHITDYDRTDDVIVISDWMHAASQEGVPGYTGSKGNGANSVLINGRGQFIESINGTLTRTTTTPPSIFKCVSGTSMRMRFISAVSHTCPMQLMVGVLTKVQLQ